MSIHSMRVGLLAVAAAAACSDAPTAATAVDTTGTIAPSTTVACASPVSLSAGQVVTTAGTNLCVSGGTASAEFALIPFNGATTPATAAFDVVASGTSSPSAAPDLISSSASLDIVPSASSFSFSTAYPRSTSFELGLRLRERATLAPMVPSARAWAARRAASRASFDVIPSSVTPGQFLRLNANSDQACTAPNYRTARVVAITNKAIVVADTGNPAGGYTDAEYASLGTTFDTLIDPLDRGAFGDPSDIDGNGRVVLFFTKTVNDLTPKNSSSYVGGFFYARDLFPAQTTPDFDACATSNAGEMFYIMVPDPSRGGPFAKANVAAEVEGTLAHEYQHLINASRRMYVNTAAADFEETWLDEGLAHTAEELLFFRVSGLQPRQNITATTLRLSSTSVDAFNNYESANFGRYSEYLSKPSDYSPYADNDSLATRGATWAFLRYAADHLASTDGDVWFRLVNSTTSGLQNLQNVFGTGVLDEIREWGTSVLTDDVTGVPSAYQQPSWNFRSMFAALDNTTVFPISNVSLTTGTHSVSLVEGANAYLRFAVPAGGAASVQWTGAPSTVQFTLVRVK